jgi:hypothetical protein
MNRDPQGAAKNLQAGNSPTFFPAPLPASATNHRAAEANRESAVYTARVRSASWRGELEQTLARQQRHGEGSNTAKRQPGLVTVKAATPRELSGHMELRFLNRLPWPSGSEPSGLGH